VVYGIGPIGTSLHSPARVTWDFGDGASRASDLRLSFQSPNGEWEPSEDPVIDPRQTVASGSLDQLAAIALVRSGCDDNTDCEEPRICAARTCRLTPCTDDEACDAGQRCEAGLCTRPAGCESEADCPLTHFCDEGLCRFRGECSDGLPCPAAVPGWPTVPRWCVPTWAGLHR